MESNEHDDAQDASQDPSLEASYDEAGAAEEAAAETPGLLKRLVDVFINPGPLMDALAANPVWVGAILVMGVMVALQMSLIPPDVFAEAQREAMLERGQDVPEMGETAMTVIRIVTPVFAMISTVIFAFIFAGLYTLIFAFILGDEGRYKQYLAVLAHAWFISTFIGIFLTPLRISTGNPQFTINLASFFFFLPEGYLLGVLRALDVTQIWGSLVIAQGAHAIDNRRSFGSAATVTLGILLIVALIAGRFM